MPAPSKRAAATILTVAARTGVSKSTVSRVVNGQGEVAPETRARVLEALSELRYRPNTLARGLVSGRCQTLGIVVYSLHNPFFGGLCDAVERWARTAGYGLLVSTSDESPEHEKGCIDMLLARGADGVVVFPVDSDDVEGARRVRENGKAVVLVNAMVQDPLLPSVSTDSVKGGYLATRHLVERGYERIIFVSRPVAYARRLEGYLEALEAAGRQANDEDVWCDVDDVTPGSLERVARRIAHLPGRKAVFALNDEVAMALIAAAHNLGLRVPADFGVVGYDNLPVGAILSPPLTSVSQPIEKLGELAVAMLLGQLEGDPVSPPHVVLEPTLVVRESCGRSTGT